MSPHIVYWRHLDRISKAVANGQDPAPLIHILWALLRHLFDREFEAAWEELHDWESGEHQTEEKVNLWELRANELGLMVELMSRRNMLEEARVVDRVG